jgi:deoxyadenosine/deoxycytidine kinase
MLVTIEGNIGVGKTTFLQRLEDDPNVLVIYEPVDEWIKFKDEETNKSLFELYYNDKTRYAFLFQIMALQTRFENLVQSHNEETKHKVVVCERSILTDYNIFAKMMREDGFLSQLELDIYKKCHAFMMQICKVHVDKMIYLRASPETCLERVQKRNRIGEDNINIEFLKHLHDSHDKWLNDMDNVIIIDAEKDIDIAEVMKHIVA